MKFHKMPKITKELQDRIQLVRRDIGTFLFHFTRTPDKTIVIRGNNSTTYLSKSALSVLKKILFEKKLIGTSKWIHGGYNCICFTEAPITELVALFSLNKIAANKKQRPRYEPYGIAVRKKWLYEKGGRPVIYDSPDIYDILPEDLKYRYVPYDPNNNVDFTWEREWRIRTDELVLDEKQTLVIVPTAEEAFDLSYEHAEMLPNSYNNEGFVEGFYPEAKWMVVSLDLFGIEINKL